MTLDTIPTANGAGVPVFAARGLTKVYEVGEVTVHALRGIDLRGVSQEAEVLSGLSEGARVILHPGDTSTDGARVKPRSAK